MLINGKTLPELADCLSVRLAQYGSLPQSLAFLCVGDKIVCKRVTMLSCGIGSSRGAGGLGGLIWTGWQGRTDAHPCKRAAQIGSISASCSDGFGMGNSGCL